MRTLLHFLVAVGVVTWAATAGASDASFDYLYIVSNEGGSSGGHTAVRFGRDVYHFQNEEGLLVLKREAADEFFYKYALLGNRTIHVSRIGTSEETVASLVEQFRRRHRAHCRCQTSRARHRCPRAQETESRGGLEPAL